MLTRCSPLASQKDLGELNQCQSALRQLYEHNIPGHPEEFLAYRILYMLYTRNKSGEPPPLRPRSTRRRQTSDQTGLPASELNLLLAQLTPEQRAPACVQHALKVQTALATSNYHSFFRLFNDAPNMGAYMMDHFVDRERVIALSTMSKAYVSLRARVLPSAHRADAWLSPDTLPFLYLSWLKSSRSNPRPMLPLSSSVSTRIVGPVHGRRMTSRSSTAGQPHHT